MIRRCILEMLDQCAVPVMALAIAIASTQSGSMGREGNVNQKADAMAGRNATMRVTGLHYLDDQLTSTRFGDRSNRSPSNHRQARSVDAKKIVTELLDQFGYDVVDAGALSEGWRFKRAKPAYCVPFDRAGLKQALTTAEQTVGVVEVPMSTHCAVGYFWPPNSGLKMTARQKQR